MHCNPIAHTFTKEMHASSVCTVEEKKKRQFKMSGKHANVL